jgi:hypothetical protein
MLNVDHCNNKATPIRNAMANTLRTIPHSLILVAQRYSPVNNIDQYNFSKFLVHSDFCTVPYGDSPSAKRLFDTFRTLCIPIILSDKIRFPFENLFIDYSKLVLQIPVKKPHFVELAMGAATIKRKHGIRENMILIKSLLEQKFDRKIHKGWLEWG